MPTPECCLKATDQASEICSDIGRQFVKYELEYVCKDLWKLYIGDIHTCGITDPSQKVAKLALYSEMPMAPKEGEAEGEGYLP